MRQNLDTLLASLEKIWQKFGDNCAQIGDRKVPLNGNIGLLFSDPSNNATDKITLRSYLSVTSNIAGCQALRRRIGHILFGFRCVYGECIFVIVSPNRRHSSLIFRLSRARVNDPGMSGRDRYSPDAAKRTAYWRHRYAGADAPKISTERCCSSDPAGAEVSKELELPEWLVRQQWLAQDPLASARSYVVFMRMLLPAAFGARMCFQCPDCNADCNARCEDHESCSDDLGNNHKSMGGYAGIATGVAFATGFRSDGLSIVSIVDLSWVRREGSSGVLGCRQAPWAASSS